MTATRQEVYSAIDTERDYQDSLWNEGTTTSGGRHTVPEFLLYMEHYLTEARRVSSTHPDPEAVFLALELVRKVTALGVSCMEQNGAPRRHS